MSKTSRTLVATGVSRGFGLAAAEHLLRTWPDIHLLVTARGAGDALTAQLADRTGNANITSVQCATCRRWRRCAPPPQASRRL